MKIVEPSFEILTVKSREDGDNLLKLIELAGRTCYSDDTEILTVDGWMCLKDISKEQKIYTYNLSTNTIEIEESNLVSFKYNNDIVKSLQKQTPFAVTPDHRMVACKAHKRDYGFVTADKFLVQGRNRGFRVPKWFTNFKNNLNNELDETIFHTEIVKHGFRKSSIEKFECKITDDFLTIVGAYVTEGHIRETNGTGAGITITQAEYNELYSLVISALDNLSWSYRVDSDPRKPEIKFIHINGGKPLKEWFKKNCGKLSRNKRLPNFLSRLSIRQLEHLMKILYLGDGSHNTTRTERYLSISKTLLDQMQMMWILLGKNANLSYLPDKMSGQYCYVEETKRDSWIVSQKHVTIERYNGMVFCPSTKNGIVCVRRDGHSFWCGNCYKSEDKITPDSAKVFANTILKSGHESVIEHVNISVRIICDRGVSHEIVRHRIASYSQESTRYCNYCKDKFANEITVIRPPAMEAHQATAWFLAMEYAEKAYFEMIKWGARPEIARSVLPNSLKTELVMTTNPRSWRNFFRLRTSPKAHPQIREIAVPMLAQFKEYMPALFGDINAENN